ncbi:MAG: tRNA (guanosine(46)-N7)-methyltransferase TrmB [Actinobacteria bacterium]|uniref:tRNA (guanine(46)-N(7))-methyltransferase n=1 Tax=freshwater metagenome TaxID=449393 RepID=A0A6J6RWK4_9ZZZZ|nr:tRNA (guanosine(46)-N7)-methyltransferase TrmB [Actinomycetota bacterium]MTA04997.1 tRNA (guanosine(46)-N7)-methyltransferase TrmB [Actinomycetota bacterium]
MSTEPKFTSYLASPDRPSIHSFKLRGARMTLAQQKAMDAFWPIYGINPDTPISPREIFPDAKRVIMEIGTGMGESTALIARDHPEDGFFGVELHRPGLGALLAHINELGLTNLRLVEEDARVLLAKYTPDHSLDAIHLYFPDPWPKTKHNKRRIVQDDLLPILAAKLVRGGYTHIATDWLPYANWIQEVFARSPLFTGGVIERPDFRPITKFEGQGLRKGHVVTDLKYYTSK